MCYIYPGESVHHPLGLAEISNVGPWDTTLLKAEHRRVQTLGHKKKSR